MQLAIVSVWRVPEGWSYSPTSLSLARGHRFHLPPTAFLIFQTKRHVLNYRETVAQSRGHPAPPAQGYPGGQWNCHLVASP